MALAAATLSSVMWKLDRLLGMLGSSCLSSVERYSPVERALTDLKDVLPSLHAATVHAAVEVDETEEEELPELALRDVAGGEWMRKVKVVGHDAEDVLDDIELELLLLLHQRCSQTMADDDPGLGASSVLLQISDIRRRCEQLMTEIALVLHSSPGGVTPGTAPLHTIISPPPPPPSDAIHQDSVYGREDDKERIVQLLLSPPPPAKQHGSQHPPVIPVVGEDGIGKTTLSWAVYSDPRISEHFDLRMWAFISQNRFFMNDATNGDSGYEGVEDVRYRMGWRTKRRFLLVIDDLEPKDMGFWESICASLTTFDGNRGSKILITSRTEEHLAKVMAMPAMPYRLGYLTEESSWSLFKDHALSGRDLRDSPSSETIAREICRRSGGSPLLLKAMGVLLHSDAARTDVHRREVLQSRCWKETKNKAAPQVVLGLCFRLLPSYLQRCLVYCSLFPKGYSFTRDQLVRLWMAQGFLSPAAAEGKKQMEDVGNDCVDWLLWCSFLAYPPVGERTIVMSSPIHDLARSHLAQTERSCKDGVEEISMDARHSSLLPFGDYYEKIQLPSHPRPLNLKSFFLVKSRGRGWGSSYGRDFNLYRLQIPSDFFDRLGHLSSLDLSCSDVTELPESACALRHLRYLGLNHTCIRALPESISTLCSLWTLELRSCQGLYSLPAGFNKLTSLRHLDFLDTRIERLLPDIGRLTNLQSLPSFFVRRERGCLTSTIGQLKHLGGLRGELRLSGIAQVLLAEEAKEAKLCDKQNIEKLTLDWYDETSVRYYGRSKMRADSNDEDYEVWPLFDDSNVTGDHELRTSASDENAAMTEQVEKGNFAVTGRERELRISGRWFREEVFDALRPHPGLRHLVVEEYRGGWLPSWMGDPAFSRLASLTLTRCSECTGLPPGLGYLPSLKLLSITSLGNHRQRIGGGSSFAPFVMKGFASLECLSVTYVRWLEEWCCGEEEGGGSAPCRLRSLVVMGCPQLKRLPPCLPSLTELNIQRCPRLNGLPIAPSLISLNIGNLKKQYSPGKEPWIFSWMGGLTNLKSVSLTGIRGLAYTPLPRLPVLRHLRVNHCRWKRDRPPCLLGLDNLVHLQRLELNSCYGLRFLPEESLPPELRALRIQTCPLLRDWCLQQWSKLAAVRDVTLDGVPYEQGQIVRY